MTQLYARYTMIDRHINNNFCKKFYKKNKKKTTGIIANLQ